MKRNLFKGLYIGLSVVLVSAGFLIASGTYHLPIPRGAGVAVGDLLYVERNDSMTNLSSGTAGKLLRAGGAATAPTWSTLIFPNAVSTGQIPYGSATNTESMLSAGTTSGQVLMGAVSGATFLPSWSTLILPNSVTTGGVFYGSATNVVSTLDSGATAGMFLRNGGSKTAPEWSTLVLPNGATTGDVMYASGSNTMNVLNAGSNGKVLQAAGASTAPAYIAKNIYRLATVDLSGTSTTLTLSADQMLCKFLVVTNGGNTAMIIAPDVTGTEFVVRNILSTAVTVTCTSAAATALSVEAGVTKHIFHRGYGYVAIASIAN